jgi:hypothetical protein
MFKSALLRKASLAGLSLAAALLAGQASAAVVATSASVSPTSKVALCPFTFTFSGTIDSNSQGEVKYRWIRSDGAISPVETLVFREPGTRVVTTTWTLGTSYSGWEAVRILSPNLRQSNKAVFRLGCHAPPPPPPGVRPQ